MVVNQEQVLAHIHNRQSTEPIVIPEPAKLLKDAYERIVPHALSAVQHGMTQTKPCAYCTSPVRP